MTGSRHAFLPLPPGGNKLALLGEVLGADSRRAQKTLVFCNTVDSCRAVEHYAREEGLAAVCYHGDMPPEARQVRAGRVCGRVGFGGLVLGSGVWGVGVRDGVGVGGRGWGAGVGGWVMPYDMPNPNGCVDRAGVLRGVLGVGAGWPGVLAACGS